MTDFKYPNLASALAAFQANIPTPSKDSSADTGKFSYDYASLDKLTPLVLGKLSEVGIAYTAAPDLTELGFGLRAKLVHESGEEFGGFYPLGAPTAPAQAIGSAITYARRYALLSLTGVAPGGEDDDGASAHTAQAAAATRADAASKPPAETVYTVQADMSAIISESNGKIEGDEVNGIMDAITGGKAPSQWTVTDLKKGREQLRKIAQERA